MSSSILFFFFVPLLAFILLAINFIFAPHNPYQEKNGAFECGFTSFLGQNRTQFSISFFIFALLFLLFDLEILLVYPYLVSSYTNESYGLVMLLVFLLALTLGFVFELGKKALSIDSRQTIENKNTVIHMSKAMIVSPQDILSYFISLFEITDIKSLDDITSCNVINNLISYTVSSIRENVVSYFYSILILFIKSLLHYLTTLYTILLLDIIKLPFIVLFSIQLSISCFITLLFSIYFDCVNEVMYFLAF